MPALKQLSIPDEAANIGVKRYCQNEMAKSHVGEVELTPWVTFNLKTPEEYDQRLNEQRGAVERNRRVGRPLAWGNWYISTFADNDLLTAEEEADYLASLICGLPRGSYGMVCRHYKFHVPSIDYNLIVGPTVVFGTAAIARRHSQDGEWRELQRISDRVVDRLNFQRREKGLQPLLTMREVQAQQRARSGRLSLAEELALLPELDQWQANINGLFLPPPPPKPAPGVPAQQTASCLTLRRPNPGVPRSRLLQWLPEQSKVKILRPGLSKPQWFFLPEIIHEARALQLARSRKRSISVAPTADLGRKLSSPVPTTAAPVITPSAPETAQPEPKSAANADAVKTAPTPPASTPIIANQSANYVAEQVIQPAAGKTPAPLIPQPIPPEPGQPAHCQLPASSRARRQSEQSMTALTEREISTIETLLQGLDYDTPVATVNGLREVVAKTGYQLGHYEAGLNEIKVIQPTGVTITVNAAALLLAVQRRLLRKQLRRVLAPRKSPELNFDAFARQMSPAPQAPDWNTLPLTGEYWQDCAWLAMDHDVASAWADAVDATAGQTDIVSRLHAIRTHLAQKVSLSSQQFMLCQIHFAACPHGARFLLDQVFADSPAVTQTLAAYHERAVQANPKLRKQPWLIPHSANDGGSSAPKVDRTK